MVCSEAKHEGCGTEISFFSFLQVEPDLASARKEAEAAKKLKKADKEDEASGRSLSAKVTKRPRGQGSFRGGFSSQGGGYSTPPTGMWPYHIPQQYSFPQTAVHTIPQVPMPPLFFQAPAQSYQGYTGQPNRQPQPGFTPTMEAAAQPPPPPPLTMSAGQPTAQGGRRFACFVCGDPSHAMKNCPNRLQK